MAILTWFRRQCLLTTNILPLPSQMVEVLNIQGKVLLVLGTKPLSCFTQSLLSIWHLFFHSAAASGTQNLPSLSFGIPFGLCVLSFANEQP